MQHQTTGNVDSITIDGLKNKYLTWEPLFFKVHVKGILKSGYESEIKVYDSYQKLIWSTTNLNANQSSSGTNFNNTYDADFISAVPSLNNTGEYTLITIFGNKKIENKISVINPVPKGAQIDLTNVSVWTCGAGQEIATFVDTSGFVNITKANEQGMGLPVDFGDFFNFVLKPNSTGYINMSFEFIGENYGINNTQFSGTTQSSIGLLQHGTISDVFNKTAIYTLDDPYSPHISNLDGISIFATNIENVTDHTLRLTYVIKIDPSAKEGTYGLGISYTGPIELLTVGDHPYIGSIPWHCGTY